MTSPDTSQPADIPRDALPLAAGGAMPLIGFGTWQLSGSQALDATGWALAAGYRHLDTATVYGNEGEVGAALAASGVPRGEVFLTTKVPPSAGRRARETLEESLAALGTDHVDLWLVHWPGDGPLDQLWADVIAARAAGLARDVGVSNFSAAQLDLVTEATGVAPAVNQIRWSPLLFDRAVVDAHRERGVVLEGYSTLRGGTLTHPVVTGIAGDHGVDPGQVLVRWHLQHGVVVIPKSARRDRIETNADVGGFSLTDEEVSRLDALGG